jgi:hypothetical protein
VIYAGGNPGLYKTTNSGGNWNYSSTGLSGYVYDLAIDPVTTNIVYAATPNGLFKSSNSGSNWTNTGCSEVNTVVIDPDDPNIIYAGTNSGVFKSTAGGGSWVVMNDGLEDIHITSLGIYPGTYLYCGTSDAGMFRWELNVGIAEVEQREQSSKLSIMPNPVTDNATLCFSIPMRSNVLLAIYDISGRVVRTLVDQSLAQGQQHIQWDRKDHKGHSVPGGIYFAYLRIDQLQVTCQVIVID